MPETGTFPEIDTGVHQFHYGFLTISKKWCVLVLSKNSRELSGRDDITDIHRESIDSITIPSKRVRATIEENRRSFDCWFESGSMPYASKHYPFENEKKFLDAFPANFISEGLDQTRGWFYTLTVLGTHLFKTAPYQMLLSLVLCWLLMVKRCRNV